MKTGEGKPHKPERILTAMKKLSMETIVKYINDNHVTDLFDIRDELTAELNKSKEKADANRALYELARETVLNAIPKDTPVTVAEIYESVKDYLPSEFKKAKVNYALTHYWENDVVKHEGKVNSYTRA